MDLPHPVRYYHTARAPNPRRTDIFFAEKGLEIERVPVDLLNGAHRQPDYLAKTGVPQVPALELSDGTVLVEAPAICRYVEALHPEPNMLGRDPLETAVIESWQRRVELRLMMTVAIAFRHTNPMMAALEDQCADWGEVNAGRIDGRLAELDQRLRDREWIAADRMTIADITAVVAVDFLRILKRDVPAEMTGLHGWRARMHARPSTAMQ